jgi:D-cysteine desulfhydrase family pyridoxal phosphate-dependent enzyme
MPPNLRERETAAVTDALDRRVTLANLPTPVRPMDRLARELDLPAGSLWVKHDDATGLAGGGNKARKLEYVCAAAIAEGCDTLVTGGAGQSNHVRMTAAAANQLGLHCGVVLAGRRPATPTGNIVLTELLTSDVRWVGDVDFDGLEKAIEELADDLARTGRRPFVVPVGGASAAGALGYVAAARELEEQVDDVALVVVADGSGGTHAGLAAGLGDHARVLGVDVGIHPDLDWAVPAHAVEAAELAGVKAPKGRVAVDHDRVGPGYGEPSDACLDALRLAGRLEGLVLDPVYSGKAMAGLLAAAREGRLPAEGRTVFLHTGGLPALLTPRYADWLRS